MPQIPKALLSLTALALLSSVSLADVVHVKGGRKIEGQVEELGDRVRIVMEGGAVTLPRSEILSIDRADLPHVDFDRRRAAIKDGDGAAAFALARFAESAGLIEQAEEAYDLAGKWAPTDEKIEAARRRFMVFARKLPADPELERAVAAAFGGDGRTLTTSHFVIGYDVPADDARRRADVIETAWRRVYEWGDSLSLTMVPPAKRMPVMVFATQARWESAVRSVAARPMASVPSAMGYYDAASGTSLVFDARSAREFVAAREALSVGKDALDRAEADLAERRADIARAEAAAAVKGVSAAERDERNQLAARIVIARKSLAEAETQVTAGRAELARAPSELDDRAAHLDLATTTHEVCHQVTFASGVCRAGQSLWLVEGIATLFEPQSRTTFSPESPNPLRVRDLRRAVTAGLLLRLRDVVTDRVFTAPVPLATSAEGAQELDLRAVAYAQSWSLTQFLAVKHRKEFAAYVRTSGAPAAGGGPQGAEARVAEFTAAFGDLDLLEREWRAFAARLPDK